MTGTTEGGRGGRDPKVVIYGSKGNSGTINFKGKLKEGNEEQFLVQLKEDIGDILVIKVSQSGLFFVPKWNLRRVTLRYLDSAESYYACFDGKVGEKALVHGDAECQKKNLNRRPLKKVRHQFRSGSHEEKNLESN
ncbi:uncharacterized protein LOC110249926 [Exaiptasia diaphana]|uniref:PLAT domain-containing protein n=1 Tax=Exaiptasia diaphana TaxID=2652724 RepID=A0A913Y0H7_EXADI|nr:uncharacterized protein LOC110249926 [Exaiptasia diaphana]